MTVAKDSLLNSEKKLMKIDSGLVNLKKTNSTQQVVEHNNALVHKFAKRASVNFPVSILKSSEVKKGINDPSTITSETSEPSLDQPYT